MPDDTNPSGLDDSEEPFAHSARSVVTNLDCAGNERDRSRQHDTDGNEHRQQHVPDHVGAEQIFAVDRDTATGRIDQHCHRPDPIKCSVDGP